MKTTIESNRSGCFERRTAVGAVILLLASTAVPCYAWKNILQDPGFESYHLNPQTGRYQLAEGAPWEEITLGRGSVQVDVNDWNAPKEMLAEGELGFTPMATKYEGDGPEQNSGRILLEQHILTPDLAAAAGNFYEAWVWLGGAGNDDDQGSDQKEEAGGWEISFFDNNDPATWRKTAPIESHSMSKDYWGERGSFLRVGGFGKVPAGVKGIRFRVHATTWGNASTPAQRKTFNTEVALDNAHLGIIDEPNMLMNGDFELDSRPLNFKGWTRPAAWPFPRNGLQPQHVTEIYGTPLAEGKHLPFAAGKYSYGFTKDANGWVKDAFTFGQYVDYKYPDRTPLLLTFNWIQGTEGGAEIQMRLNGSQIELVAEYQGENGFLGAKSFWFEWPVPAQIASGGRYDQNNGQPYSPRMILNPPEGTRRIGVHVNFMTHMGYLDKFRGIKAAVDDFLLVPADKP